MSKTKKTAPRLGETAVTTDNAPYIVQVTTDGKDSDCTIFERKPFGPHREIIRKVGFRKPEDAREWGEYHCQMRDYRPYTFGQVV